MLGVFDQEWTQGLLLISLAVRLSAVHSDWHALMTSWAISEMHHPDGVGENVLAAGDNLNRKNKMVQVSIELLVELWRRKTWVAVVSAVAIVQIVGGNRGEVTGDDLTDDSDLRPMQSWHGGLRLPSWLEP